MDTQTASNSDGNVRRTLLEFIVPMVVSLLFIGSTSVVDALFLGRLGPAALTAFGFTLPVTGLLFQVQVAFGIGVTSVVARASGAGDGDSVRRLSLHGGLAGLLLSAALASVVAHFDHQVFRHLGATPDQFELIEAFMLPWLLGTPAFFLVIWGTASMRGVGNVRASALAFMLQAAVNWIAVPALTSGLGPLPAYGIAGAAYGSVLGYAVASVVVLRQLARDSRFALPTRALQSWTLSLRAIFAVALPAILTYILAPLTSGLVTALLASRGADAVAAYGVVSRLFDGFLSMVPLAIASGLGPFVGFAWGAGKRASLREAVGICRRWAFLWGAGCYLLGALLAQPLAALFSDDPQLTPTIASALRFLPLGFASYGMLLVANAVYNAIGKAGVATMLALVRTLGLSVPLAYLAAHFGGPWLFIALAVSSILADLLGSYLLARDGLRSTRAPDAARAVGA